MNAFSHFDAVEPQQSSGNFGPDNFSPVQADAYRRLLAAIDATPVTVLAAEAGVGKTTMLTTLARELGGEFISTEDALTLVRRRDALECAESVLMALEEAFDRSDLVVVDDIQILTSYSGKGSLAPVILDMMQGSLRRRGKRLVFGATPASAYYTLWDIPNRHYVVSMAPLDRADSSLILANLLPAGSLDGVDLDLIWRQASGLTGHQLRALAGLLEQEADLTTDKVLQALSRHLVKSNVKVQEVEALSFETLPGSEAIAQKLETHILLPLEHAELARELEIRPKRGVLLYGPPGTGKTSIGRALAHRMKGKFFLIDGSFTTEPPTAFFSRVTSVVREAKANAPSVLFVDDADVLFGIEHIAGFSRYLLSLLDGVESETAGGVCLMMTAMNAARVPGSVLRSGRVELWLETRLPDSVTRAAIVQRWLGEAPLPSDDIEFSSLAELTEGFTPADLRRIVADANSLRAVDIMAGGEVAPVQLYLERAIADLIQLRGKMADNLDDESLRITSLSAASIYTKDGVGRAAKYGAGIGGLAASAESCAVAVW